MTVAVLDYSTGNVDVFTIPEYNDVEEFLSNKYLSSQIEWMEVSKLNIKTEVR